MKVFITGISGLLGLNAALQLKDSWEVSGCFYSHPVHVQGVKAVQTDVTSYEDLRDILVKVRPDAILHTAGMTSVDRCEEDPTTAHRLNVHSTENVARLAGTERIRLIHISTDHLFDGREILVKEEAQTKPLNVYAKTKRDAEIAVRRYAPEALIIRTNFYGWGTRWRKSFSDRIHEGLKNHHDIAMFTDVFFTPIFINDLIDIVFELIQANAGGVYNVGGRERVSKYFFATQLADLFGHSLNGIRAMSIDGASLRAKRPKDMSLDSEKVAGMLGRRMPALVEGLLRLKTLYEQEWPVKINRAVETSAEVKKSAPLRLMQG